MSKIFQKDWRVGLVISILLLLARGLIAREWTVAVYMAADNDLSYFATLDIEEMKRLSFSDRVSIVIQIDRPYETCKRYLVRPGKLTLLEDIGEVDMCAPEEIANFARFIKETYPADKYLIILWDHGTGWVTGPKRSFGSDWSSNNTVGISDGELGRAIFKAHQALDKKIEILCFDACLMAMVEVASELAQNVKYLIASEHWIPVEGYPYDKVLNILISDPKISPEEFGRSMIDTYIAHYPNLNTTLSLIDVDKIRPLNKAVKNLIEGIGVGPVPEVFKKIRESVQTFSSGTQGIPTPQDDNIDLGDFLIMLNDVVGSDPARSAVEALEQTVKYVKHNGGLLTGSRGVAVWFPDTYFPDFKPLIQSYTGLVWSKETGWERFLNWFYNKDDLPPTQPSITFSQVADNNLTIYWSKAYDLASVRYNLIEGRGILAVYEDAMEDTSLWLLNGFSFSSTRQRSGTFSLFTGQGNRLDNSAQLKNPVYLDNFGLTTFYASFDIEERNDSLIFEVKRGEGDWQIKKAVYGLNPNWTEYRIMIDEPGTYQFRFRYRTDSARAQPGGYIDDLKISLIQDARYLIQDFPDTSFYLFNKPSGVYYFTVNATDLYNNQSNYSQFQSIALEDYATPYSIPNPFIRDCTIILDYPDNPPSPPIVEIYSIDGRKIKRFSSVIGKRIYWNGKGDDGKDVGSGLYFVSLHTGSFKRLGKIARVD
ncbi:MAG: clostripain-related cysteine peptidase [candidate division WOR-3 bacterium]